MSAVIDNWSLNSVEEKYETSISQTRTIQERAASSDIIDLSTIQSISGSIKGRKDNLREACNAYEKIIPSSVWPRIFASVKGHDLEWIKKYGLLFDDAINQNYQKLGITAFRCPPHAPFLQAIAEIPQVLALSYPDSPVEIYNPMVGRPAMVDVRGMVGVDEQIQKDYGYGVRIAIIDTGIDPSHPDLARLNESNCANFTHDANYLDYSGHGTHVAGIAVGSGAASDGQYSGIAPNCELVIAKVLDNSGSGFTEWIINGMAWSAFEQNAQVINMSLGNNGYPDGQSLISIAVENLAKKGFIMCVAVGNSGPRLETIGPPADAHSAISVGAIDKDFRLTDFSSRGSKKQNSAINDKPNIVAPGHFTVAPRSQYCDFPGVEGGYYACLSGTSMAAPVMSGCSALILSYLQKQGEQPTTERVKELLYDNAKPLSNETGSPYAPYETGNGLAQVQGCFSRKTKKSPQISDKEPATKKPIKSVHKQSLSRELSFINGVSGRLDGIKEVMHPAKGVLLDGINFKEIDIDSQQASDRQLLYRLLLDTDLTPMEIPDLINEYPQNPIKFWRVEFSSRLANKISRPPELWIGAYCWSPLGEIIDNDQQKDPAPAGIQVITNRLKEITTDENVEVVLFAGSTSEWEGDLSAKVGDRIFCIYYSPSDFGGWKYALPIQQIAECGLAWFAENMYPEDDDAISQRIRNWYKEVGDRESRWALNDAAQSAGSPITHMENYFRMLDKKKPKIWNYYPERKLLLSTNR